VKRLREHPIELTCVAFALAAGAVVAIGEAFGFDAFRAAWRHVHPGWLVLVLGAELLAPAAYVVAYRVMAGMHDGPRLSPPLAVRAVVAGFGPFAAGGGFALDKRVLHAVEDDERAATIRVLGLGALEWALLAPAAWISAVALLAAGGAGVMPSLLWPWALVTPLGFAVGLWLAAPGRRERVTRGRGAFDRSLRGIGLLHSLLRDPASGSLAAAGAAMYWALDIASLYGAIRFFGLRLDIAQTILAYATGYALTRRSMPLGGAGATEVLMTFSLHWVGLPVPSALAAVVVYRVFNFALPALPALLVRPRVKPLLDAADEERTPAQAASELAAPPLGPVRRWRLAFRFGTREDG
jgi:uncharacterized membrane protein YbhN (UPF0104 family)